MHLDAQPTDPAARRSPWQLYGWLHLAWLAFCIVHTRILFRGCQLVRLPIFIRGRKRIRFGSGFVCGYMNRLDAFGAAGCIRFGNGVQLNDYVHIGAIESVTIGNNVLIASRVFITDHDHGVYSSVGIVSFPEQPPQDRVELARPVRIGNNVWLGEGVCVLAGSTIGDGSVIGAGAVVTGDIPAGCVAVGVPARVVRRYSATHRAWLKVEP